MGDCTTSVCVIVDGCACDHFSRHARITSSIVDGGGRTVGGVASTDRIADGHLRVSNRQAKRLAIDEQPYDKQSLARCAKPAISLLRGRLTAMIIPHRMLSPEAL